MTDLNRIARVFARDADRIEKSIVQCASKMTPEQIEQAKREAAALRRCCDELPNLGPEAALAAIDAVCQVCEGRQ